MFALGVIVYELVTGARPFRGDVQRATLDATLRAAPVFSAQTWKRVPPRVLDVTARMLARDPERRFADGTAALHALREVGAEPTMPTMLLAPATAHEIVVAETQAASGPPRRRRVVVGSAVAASLSVAALAMMVHRSRPPRPPPLEGMAWIDVGTITVGLKNADDLDRECAAIGPRCNRQGMQRRSTERARQRRPVPARRLRSDE